MKGVGRTLGMAAVGGATALVLMMAAHGALGPHYPSRQGHGASGAGQGGG